MPFVLDGERGRITIAAKGMRHEMVTAVDRVRQAPVIEHRESEFVHFGTKFRRSQNAFPGSPFHMLALE
jgi:hypothetical protein